MNGNLTILLIAHILFILWGCFFLLSGDPGFYNLWINKLV